MSPGRPRAVAMILLFSPALAACSGSSDSLGDLRDHGDAAPASPVADGAPPVVVTDAAPSDDATAPRGDDGGAPGDAASDATSPATPDAAAASPCAGGTVGLPSDGGSATIGDYGFVDLASPDDTPIVSLTTSLHVPPKPPASGTVFLWPGLQPSANGANFQPIDNGVLQPVLTWGLTCAPGSPSSAPFASWWVSAQYVNTFGKEPGYTGCLGGAGMDVDVGDDLAMAMVLAGTTWKQTVTSAKSGKSVTFDIDLKGQSQNYAELMIEGYQQEPTVPIVFKSTVITFARSSPGACAPFRRGPTDDYTAPQSSQDGTRCCIDTITLRAKGI